MRPRGGGGGKKLKWDLSRSRWLACLGAHLQLRTESPFLTIKIFAMAKKSTLLVTPRGNIKKTTTLGHTHARASCSSSSTTAVVRTTAIICCKIATIPVRAVHTCMYPTDMLLIIWYVLEYYP